MKRIRLYCLLVFASSALLFPQSGGIFTSKYFPVTLGRSVLPQVRTSAALLYEIGDTGIAKREGRFVTAKKAGKTQLIARTADNTLRDTTEIVVTSWLSGISSLSVLDSFRVFIVTGIKNDSIFGYTDASTARSKLFLKLRNDFTRYDTLKLFNEVPSNMFSTASGSFVLERKVHDTLARRLWKTTDMQSWRQVMRFPSLGYQRPPNSTFSFLGSCSDDAGNTYLAEYLSEDALYPDYRIKIFKSTDGGESWDSAYTFPSRTARTINGGVRHAHTICFDPYQRYLWLSTGDNQEQSRIYYHDNKLLPDSNGQVTLKLLGGNYHEEYKSLGFWFTRNYIYWGMDSPTDTQKVFRIARRSFYPTITVGPPPLVTSKNDYRELVGVFRDKPFWFNLPIRNGSDSLYILETAYEMDYAPLIDRRIRTYVMSEGDYPQIQEVLGTDALSTYDYFSPRGQLSDGTIIFQRNRTVIPRNAAVKTRLNWVNVEKGIWQGAAKSEIAFAGNPLRLSGGYSQKGTVYLLPHYLSELPLPLPEECLMLNGTAFEIFSPDTKPTSAYAEIPVPDDIHDENFVKEWLCFDREANTWKNLFAKLSGGKMTSALPLSAFSWLVPVSYPIASKYRGGVQTRGAAAVHITAALDGELPTSERNIGGSFDGSSVAAIGPALLNGQRPLTAKFKGGEFDGCSLAGLSIRFPSGNQPEWSKYYGGSVDGSTSAGLSIRTVSGIEPLAQKYYGGAFDGVTCNSTSRGTLTGIYPSQALYSGGPHDGSSAAFLSPRNLSGTLPLSDKHSGGHYDGSVLAFVARGTLNGVPASEIKFTGGVHDGAAFLNYALETPGGVQPLAGRSYGGASDGASWAVLPQGNLSGIYVMTAKYGGEFYDGAALTKIAAGTPGAVFPAAAKYTGGTYDGSSQLNTERGTPGGVQPLAEKYCGGAFDGIAFRLADVQSMNGALLLTAKYAGGSFDGFTESSPGTSSLAGMPVAFEKFLGGSRDGYTNSTAWQAVPNGSVPEFVKYYGGVHDGSSSFFSGSQSANGILLLAAKYWGGSYDGAAVTQRNNISTGGNPLAAEKYFGGQRDGYALTGTGIGSPGGTLVTGAKYTGGAFDGAAFGILRFSNAQGAVWQASKYSGGPFDGSAISLLSAQPLSVLAHKYRGGSYDGYQFAQSAASGLSGALLAAGKYFGSGYDGAAESTMQFLTMSGTTIAVLKYRGGAFDGSAFDSLSRYPLPVSVNLRLFIEGFYEPASGKMVSADTVTAFLMMTDMPFGAADSARTVLSREGYGSLTFHSVTGGSYYLAVRHRNSIETWSQLPQTLGALTLNYDFTSDSSRAFGDNAVKRGNAWCIFSGDVNQDGIIDFSDIVEVDNASLNYLSGYVSADLTGDDFVDFSDLSVCDTNQLNFISVIKPGGKFGRNSLLFLRAKPEPLQESSIQNER